jgi:exodeoxyribonuclease VII large subunit
LAIISSREAAGLQDFIQHLQHNPYGYAFGIDLYPAAMQGNLVEREVLEQLQKIEANLKRYDAVIIVRGGGAKTDLMAFNGLNLCRAIAAHPLPILTGIGHDEDISLADLVANRSFKTPTAVADFLLERCLQVEQQANHLHQQIQFLVQQRLGQEQQRLSLWAQRLPLLVQQYRQQKGFELQRLAQRLQLLNLDYTLQRGFALVLSPQGQVLPTVEAVQDDRLEIRLQDGSLFVEVKEKKKR